MTQDSITISKIIPGGMALGTAKTGKKFFFWDALPGETVTDYRITKNKASYAEALTLSIIHPSPHRVKPKDACFLATSPWQIMDYPYELELKSALVQEIFREHGIAIEQPAVITDHQPYHYRNKMEYSLYYSHEDSQIHLAFHQRGSHRKVPISQSSIERPEIFARALEIVDNLNRTHEEARRFQSLLLRCSQDGTVSGGLLENHQPHPVFPPLTDTILGHPYSYSPNGFFQINLPVYELALQEIQSHTSTSNVLDLYAGVGTIGLSVAHDRHLTLVESSPAAFAELENNVERATKEPSEHMFAAAKLAAAKAGPRKDGRTAGHENNSLATPTTLFAKSEDALAYITPTQTVIVDPPRAGCDAALLNKFLEITPEKIIYLSCNPATQARDVKILLEKYRLTSVKVFNFFPRTPHIENLIILEKI